MQQNKTKTSVEGRTDRYFNLMTQKHSDVLNYDVWYDGSPVDSILLCYLRS